MSDARERLRYVDVAPTGTRRQVVHKNYGHDDRGRIDPRTGYYEADVPAYPSADPRYRALRQLHRLTLGQAALATGLDILEVSGLERGRATCDGDALSLLYLAAAQARVGTP